MPLVIGKISDTNAKPSKIYQDLCNNPATDSANIPVTQPET